MNTWDQQIFRLVTNNSKGTALSLLSLFCFCVTNIKYIMYNVQDYIVLHNKAVGPVICEGWHFTLMQKTPA